MAKKLRSPQDVLAELKVTAAQLKKAHFEHDLEAEDSTKIEALRGVLQWQVKELPKWAASVGIDPNECFGHTIPVANAVLKLTKN